MIVTIDGQRLAEALPAGASLQAIVEQVRSRLGTRIVVQISRNGEVIPTERLSAELARTVGPGDQIDFESGQVGPLVAEALRAVRRNLSELVAAAPPDVAPSARFIAYMDAWRDLQTALSEGTSLLGREIRTADGPLGPHLRELTERFRELRDAFQSRDNVLLDDMLAVDLPELANKWQGLLESAARELSAAGACAEHVSWH